MTDLLIDIHLKKVSSRLREGHKIGFDDGSADYAMTQLGRCQIEPSFEAAHVALAICDLLDKPVDNKRYLMTLHALAKGLEVLRDMEMSRPHA